MPFLLAEILNFQVQHTLLVWEVLVNKFIMASVLMCRGFYYVLCIKYRARLMRFSADGSMVFRTFE